MRQLLLLIGLVATVAMQASDGYRVTIDLQNVYDDRVRVVLRPPTIDADTATLIFPYTTPGTYETHQWWRYVSAIKAIDTAGREMTVRRSADSQFVIENARALNAIAYEVDDSFDATDPNMPAIFEPAGTSFQRDTLMQLNHSGLVGYIDGYQRRPFQINVLKPKRLYGASALPIARLTDTLDVYAASTYDELNDSPVLYAVPDTASFTVAGTRILVACADRKNHDYAKKIAPRLKAICTTVSKFLGKMPVHEYAFLIYLWDFDTTATKWRKRGFGALEHSYSSLYFLSAQQYLAGLDDMAAHEFLHILMPLNLHSEEIETFNFRAPQMSRHLWLYEGMTEYFAHVAQVRDSTMKPAEFLQVMRNKIRESHFVPKDFSFTEFSRNVLSEENQRRYPLVYSYGAVNGLLLDIVMRDATGGDKGALDLMRELMLYYTKSMPFKDTALFDEIARVAPASVADYCRRFIGGNERIPIGDIVKRIGWTYIEERKRQGPTFGVRGEFSSVEGMPGFILSPEGPNVLEVQQGDRLRSIDGKNLMQAGEAIWRKLLRPEKQESITIVVRRGDQDVTLTGTTRIGEITERNVLEEDPDATAAQKTLRKAVLGW